jgi:hypothetical protein
LSPVDKTIRAILHRLLVLLLLLLLLLLLMLHLQLLLPQFALALKGSKDGLGLDELGIGVGNALLLHLLEPLFGGLANAEAGVVQTRDIQVQEKGQDGPCRPHELVAGSCRQGWRSLGAAPQATPEHWPW